MRSGALRFLLFGLPLTAEEQRYKYKIIFVNSVLLFAGVAILGMGFIRWPSSHMMGALDFLFAGLSFILLAYLQRHRDRIDLVSTLGLLLSFALFFAIYLSQENTMRLGLFFPLLASAFFLKGRRAGRIWLIAIMLSIVAVHFLPYFHTGYSHLDIFTTCLYLIAQFFIFENYEVMKEAQNASENELKVQLLAEERTKQKLENLVQERTGQLLAAQEELVRKEKLAVLGQVAGSVGHELRNPLGVMSNAVYYLQTVLPDADQTTREYLDILQSEIAGSERIVSDLLDSVRTRPPQPETVWVAELVGQSLAKLVVPAAVELRLDIPPALPPLLADAQQIQQVLCNLISNGIDAMPGGGTLRIRAKADEEDKNVTISVEDSGTGIAPEQMDKLFQPLYTTKARGIGLGLVVVRNLTEVNGGRVDVKSEPGKGALFSITLPATDERGS
jgi:signal transduction histidine kinase